MDIPDTAKFIEKPIDWGDANKCIVKASRHYDVHPLVIKAVMLTENGKQGTVSENTNATYDLGPMQVNSSNIPFLKKEFPWLTFDNLANNTCANIVVATYFLRHKINGADTFWQGVGNYHSGTPKYHDRYMARLVPIYRNLVKRSRKMLKRIRLRRKTYSIR